MYRIFCFVLISGLLLLAGFGCTIEKKSEITDDGAITVPSGDADAPVPEDIGEVDTFEQDEEPADEIDSLIEEIETLEAEADDLFDGYTGIDTSNDEELNI